MKILTLFFCAVATSTVFWVSPSTDAPSDEVTTSSEEKQPEPEGNCWGLDPTKPHFLVKFEMEYEQRMRRADGNYTEIYRDLSDELKKTDISDAYKNAVKHARYRTAIKMPGQPPIDALYLFAEMNWTNPVLLNSEAWNIAERGKTGEQVPEKLVAASVYLAERAVELDPNNAHAFDTLSHLYELQDRTGLAIHSAELAVRYATDSTVVGFKQRLKELKQQTQLR